jgi:predicted ATP-grasp superfamily ATP-dependent carboligase
VYCRTERRTVTFPPVFKGGTTRELVPPWRRMRLCPDPWLSCESVVELQEVAVRVAEACDATGLGEVEMIVPDTGPPCVLEINPRVAGTMRISALATRVPILSTADLDNGRYPGGRHPGSR